MTDQLNRDLGRLEGKVEKLDDDVDDLKRMVADMHRTLTEARGGWKTLMAVAGLSSLVTGGLVKAAQALRIIE